MGRRTAVAFVVALGLGGLLGAAPARSATPPRVTSPSTTATTPPIAPAPTGPAPPPLGNPVTVAGVDSPTALGCAPAGPGATGTCLLIGTVGESETWVVVPITGGVPGRAVSVPGIPSGETLSLGAVACASATLCEAVGSLSDAAGDSFAAVVTVRSGQPSAPVQVADPTAGGDDGSADDALAAVGCDSATDCEAVGEGLDAQAVDITAGTPQTLTHDEDPAIETLDGILCAAGGCTALGSGGDGRGIAVPVSGGTLQTAVEVPHTGTLLAGACPPAAGSAATTCAVLAQTEFGRSELLTDAAGSFGTPVAVRGQLSGIACETATSCVLAGSNADGASVLVPADPATGATGAQLPVSLTIAGSPTCLSATSCLAAGSVESETTAASSTVLEPFGSAVTEVTLNVGAPHVHGTTVSLPLTCATACAGQIVETTTIPGSGHHRRSRTLTVGRTAYSLTTGGRRAVAVRLHAGARRRLDAAVQLTVQLEVVPTAAAGGHPVIAALRTATLRR